MKRSLMMMVCLVVCGAGLALLQAQDQATSTDLKLFEKGVKWKFGKVNGEGSFQLATDGDKPIGVMNYDFSKEGEVKGGRYLVTKTETSIPDGVGEIRFAGRSSRALKILVRLIDETGQTHQASGSLTGSGEWETIKVSLSKKMQHWKGAADGKVHFPIKQIVLGVTGPKDDPKTGKVEFADLATVAK
ncbi:MAG: hypothetical protein WD042_19700 [Phycisphaeraceae bacterium]